MPPRVGKTTILMFFVTWLIGRKSEASNLYSAYSDTITKAFYNGVLEIINDPVTYLWHDVFRMLRSFRPIRRMRQLTLTEENGTPRWLAGRYTEHWTVLVTATVLKFPMTLSAVLRKHLIKTALFLRGARWIITCCPVQKKSQNSLVRYTVVYGWPCRSANGTFRKWRTV